MELARSLFRQQQTMTSSPVGRSSSGLDESCEVAVIGGGPSGAVVASLLAEWGHDVVLLTKRVEPERLLANSLPPSTINLLNRVGIHPLVAQVGFPTFGNTVWWGPHAGRVESFSPDGQVKGYQVDRALLDPLLVDLAERRGAVVRRVTRVQQVALSDAGASVSYTGADGSPSVRAQLVLDCSGRAGVVAVPHRLRQHVAGGRMQALSGVWRNDAGWNIDHPTHTAIETCADGWAWSIPTSSTERHVGIMIDGATSRLTREASLSDSYRRYLTLTGNIERQLGGARLLRVGACDATVYGAVAHAGRRFLLVGDAGSTINPLSSFGVKKALTSAWLAAVSAHTMLTHRERTAMVTSFYSSWEQSVWQDNLRRAREFANEALAHHASRFWSEQAALPVDPAALPLDERELLSRDDVLRAHELIRGSDKIVFALVPETTFVSAPIVRGREIVSEPALALGPEPRDVVRYVRGVDLVHLASLAPACSDVPTLFDRYQQEHGAVNLADFLAVLALLVARHVLRVNSFVH